MDDENKKEPQGLFNITVQGGSGMTPPSPSISGISGNFGNLPIVNISPYHSLEEHNRRRGLEFAAMNTYPHGSGFGCPKCGKQLMIMDGNVLASLPPKIRVVCEGCGHVDSILM